MAIQEMPSVFHLDFYGCIHPIIRDCFDLSFKSIWKRSQTHPHPYVALAQSPSLIKSYLHLRAQASSLRSPQACIMARFLYRLLRAFNFVGSADQSQMRSAMRSGSMLRDMMLADLQKPLSYMLPLTGNAMSPLFNASVNDMKTVQDRLVIRRLSGSTRSFMNKVYVNDVVIIRDPNDSRRKYVRRIAALEGAQMASEFGDAPFRVPASHCWVERDNREATAPDSSSFGPLGLDYVIGRVMYAIRTATDHGRVNNSPYAMASDAVVMAQESVTKYLDPPPEDSPPEQAKDD